MGQIDKWHYTHRVMVSDDVKPHYSSLFYIVCSENKSHGSVRLVGSSAQEYGEGRLDVCNLGVWQTVCDHYFDMLDANVVCQELGYPPKGN